MSEYLDSGSNTWEVNQDDEDVLLQTANSFLDRDIKVLGTKYPLYVVTENDVSVTTDATKGVAPYNTSYGYTNITVNNIEEEKIKVGSLVLFICTGILKVESANRNTRIRFGTSGTWYPLYHTTSIAGGSSYLGVGNNRLLTFSDKTVSTGAIHVLTDSNTTYTPPALGGGYGTCSTAAATAAKVVTLSNYALVSGGIVSVKFTNAVPANATMNINSKGAKNIFYNNARITAGIIKAGDIATFVYDGTQYRLIAINTDITKQQEKLVSGTNIKTINGESILGSGDIPIDTPTVTVNSSQFISENEVQLTDEQYNILTTNTFAKIDASAVGLGVFGVQCGIANGGIKYAQLITSWFGSDGIYSGTIYAFEISDNKVMTIMQSEFPTTEAVQGMIDESGGGLPSVTTADAGKFLRVNSEGKWVAEAVPNASEYSF